MFKVMTKEFHPETYLSFNGIDMTTASESAERQIQTTEIS